MAKRSTTSTESHYSTVRLLAFVGLALSAIAGLISFILMLLNKIKVEIKSLSKIEGICGLISTLALFVSVWLAAWDYVKFKSKTWRILYFIFLVLGILGLFGVNLIRLF